MPGQDHAPGSDVYGNPDSWVQGQIDQAKKDGYLDANGNPTQKEKDLESSMDDDDYDDEDYSDDDYYYDEDY